MKNFVRILSFIALVGLMGCGSAQIISSWKNPETPSLRVKTILVLGLIEDQKGRERLESSLGQLFGQQGYRTVLGHDILPMDAPEFEHDHMLRAKVKSAGVEAALVLNVTGVQTDPSTRAPKTQSEAPTAAYSHLYHYAHATRDAAVKRDHLIRNSTFVLEARLYAVDSEDLMWKTEFQSAKAQNLDDLAWQFAVAIADKIREQKLIKR